MLLIPSLKIMSSSIYPRRIYWAYDIGMEGSTCVDVRQSEEDLRLGWEVEQNVGTCLFVLPLPEEEVVLEFVSYRSNATKYHG